jgi:hypothetical protein
VEVLYIARLRGYKIAEIAIDWTNVEGSKVNVLLDSPKMLMEVIGIKLGAIIGRYRKMPDGVIADVGLSDSSFQSPAAKD